MATTILPILAVRDAAAKIKKIPTEDVQVGIVNDIHQRIWTAGNWVWTLGEIELSTNPASDDTYTQEFPLASNITDCSRFVNGRLITPERGLNLELRTDSVRDIEPVSFLPLTGLKGQPTHFQYVPGTTDKIRFSTAFNAEKSRFYGVYKKVFPVLAAKDLYYTTKIALPDEWYWVFREGVLWKLYEYADDTRGGNVSFSEGRTQYGGQGAIFQAALMEMMVKEPRFMEDSRDVRENVS
jgi:hypothetical protein